MRFDQEVWRGMSVTERMGYTVGCLLDRARRFSECLHDAGVPHDIAHLGDLLRVGLLDRTWRDRVRPALRERFDRAMDEAERHYGGSAH